LIEKTGVAAIATSPLEIFLDWGVGGLKYPHLVLSSSNLP
jgi:hypothetical protein